MADNSNQDKKSSWQTRTSSTKKHHGRQEQAVQKASWQTKARSTKKHHGRQEQEVQTMLFKWLSCLGEVWVNRSVEVL